MSTSLLELKIKVYSISCCRNEVLTLPRIIHCCHNNLTAAVKLSIFKITCCFFQSDYPFHRHSIIYALAPNIENYIHLNTHTVMRHINHVLKRLHFCKKVNFLQPNELLHLCISLRTEYKIKSL